MITKLRSHAYRLARFLGDVRAIQRGPRAMVKRWVRKAAGRTYGRWMRRLLP